MGMLLSIPMLIVGVGAIWIAKRAASRNSKRRQKPQKPTNERA